MTWSRCVCKDNSPSICVPCASRLRPPSFAHTHASLHPCTGEWPSTPRCPAWPCAALLTGCGPPPLAGWTRDALRDPTGVSRAQPLVSPLTTAREQKRECHKSSTPQATTHEHLPTCPPAQSPGSPPLESRPWAKRTRRAARAMARRRHARLVLTYACGAPPPLRLHPVRLLTSRMVFAGPQLLSSSDSADSEEEAAPKAGLSSPPPSTQPKASPTGSAEEPTGDDATPASGQSGGRKARKKKKKRNKKKSKEAKADGPPSARSGEAAGPEAWKDPVAASSGAASRGYDVVRSRSVGRQLAPLRHAAVPTPQSAMDSNAASGLRAVLAVEPKCVAARCLSWAWRPMVTAAPLLSAPLPGT